MILAQLVNGLMEGAMLFLMASGLTLIFGISRIINFAHGSFYMLGAFIGRDIYMLIPTNTVSSLLLAAVLSGVAVALIGMLLEVTLLRRVYRADMLMQLLLTVALVLIIRDVAKSIWGIHMVSTPIPPALAGALRIGNNYVPLYPLLVTFVGIVVAIAMFCIVRYTRAGILLRATRDDAAMIGMLGVNSRHVLTAVFGLGCFLAGLAGALAAPYNTINYLLDTTVIILAFVVVVIGGLGSLVGAFCGAIAVGVIKALSVLYAERLAMVIVFLVMAGALLLRSFRTLEED